MSKKKLCLGRLLWMETMRMGRIGKNWEDELMEKKKKRNSKRKRREKRDHALFCTSILFLFVLP